MDVVSTNTPRDGAEIPPEQKLEITEAKMRRDIAVMDERIEAHASREAQEAALKALAHVGMGTEQRIFAMLPDSIVSQIEIPLRGFAAKALTSLGINRTQNRDRNHLDAFRLFELALALDPANGPAAANLSDLAVEADENRIKASSSHRESRWQFESLLPEIAREKIVGQTAIQTYLAAKWGYRHEEIDSGVATIKAPGDPVERAHVCWCLGNLAKLRLQGAKDAHQEAQVLAERRLYLQRDHLLEVAEHNIFAALQVVGLSKRLEKLVPRVREDAATKERPWGAQTKNVAQSFNILGSIRELQMRHTDAMDCYYLASLIDPGLVFPASRLEKLQVHNPRYHVPEELDRKYGPLPKPRVPAAQPAQPLWSELRGEEHPGDTEALIQGSVPILLQLPFPKDDDDALDVDNEGRELPEDHQSWKGLLELSGDVIALERDREGRTGAFLKHTEETVLQWWEKGANPSGYVQLVGLCLMLDRVGELPHKKHADQARTLADQAREILDNHAEFTFGLSVAHRAQVWKLVAEMADIARVEAAKK